MSNNVLDILTYRVRISLECPKFYYEIGHYAPSGEFNHHVISGFMFDSYGVAEREAVAQMERIQKAMALRLRRQEFAYARRCAGGNGGDAA